MIKKIAKIESKIAGNLIENSPKPKIEMLIFWRILNGRLIISFEKILPKFKLKLEVAEDISPSVKPLGATKIANPKIVKKLKIKNP